MFDAHAGIVAVAAIRYAATLAECGVIVRLLWMGLGARFRWFLAYLAVDLLGSAVMAPFGVASNEYRLIWYIKQPALMMLAMMAAWEMLRLLSEGYPKFDRTRRQLAIGAAVVGAIAAVIVIRSDIRTSNWTMPVLQGFFIARRAEAVMIAAAMAVPNLFFLAAPAPARRNSVLHARVLLAFLVADAIGYFAMLKLDSTMVQIVLGSVGLACFTCWATLLTRAGDVIDPLKPLTPEEIRAMEEQERAGFEKLDRMRLR